ncbi:PIN domain-containing protein [Variovorax sp. LjRoot84]|uniref:PIN domain-containing protein n=1 Tax=Variovorax sp. LjRoot84 TaxID=3342340 RepID=UPI003ECFE359
MSKTYLLIDLQNRRPPPEYVASWMGANGEAWIFFGEQEVKVLPQYLELGKRVSIVDISRPGKNSLDFHLVLYLGYLAGRHEPNTRFVIVAADGDYDPAIAHARSKGLKVERLEDLVIPCSMSQARADDEHPFRAPVLGEPESVRSASPSARVAAKTTKQKTVIVVYGGILEDLRKAGRPRNLEALKRRIQSRIGPEPAPDTVANVISRLETMDLINIVDGTLNYAQVAREAPPVDPG